MPPLPQFFRNVQLTGGGIPLGSTASTVFVAAMDEGGGGLNMRQNIMFRLLNNTWNHYSMGGLFTPAGDGLCPSNPFFAIVNPIWRQMSWGQPAVGPNGVVHYAYAGHSTSTSNDNGDIFYVRSADNGMTWSAPLQLNTDPDGLYKTQWMPSVSVNSAGKVTVSWYDRRSATSACNVVTDPGCNYERYGVQSSDNGLTWGPNFPISDGLIPQPAQNDPGVPPCFAGDFNYSTAWLTSAFVTWTDGRRNVGGVQVQDVDFANVPEP